jgi:RNA polymerase sigma-70 factor (ECF subfamily)
MQDPTLAETTLLVSAACQGDRRALEALFERYLPRVRRIVAVRLGRTAAQLVEVEDVVQDTLLEAFQDLARPDHRTESSFCNWLARCVENNIKDTLRRGHARKRGSGGVARQADLSSSGWSSVLPHDGPTPTQIARAHELDAQLEQAMLALNPRYREAIILRVACGMSAAEAAVELGLRTAADAQKLFERARDQLKGLIGGGAG